MSMPVDSEFSEYLVQKTTLSAAENKFPSKMDVLDRALLVLTAQLTVLDSIGSSMASIHLNTAIEQIHADRLALDKRQSV